MVVDSWAEMGKLGPRGFFCLISTFTFTGQSWFDPLAFISFRLKRKLGLSLVLQSTEKKREKVKVKLVLSEVCV